MKNLFRNIFLVSCLLLTVGAVEAQAQTAQQAVRHQPLPAKVALKNAKEQLSTLDPQSARYADLQGKIAQLETKVQQETKTQNAELKARIDDYKLILAEQQGKLSLQTPQSKEYIETQHVIEKAKMTIVMLENKSK